MLPSARGPSCGGRCSLGNIGQILVDNLPEPLVECPPECWARIASNCCRGPSTCSLQTLVFGRQHGHGIATSIQRSADDALLIDHGSLYPALQRLERAGLISSDWGISENNR